MRPKALVSIGLGLALLSCRRGDVVRPLAPPPGAPTHPTLVNRPARLTGVEVTQADGSRARIACATCHALRPAGPLPAAAQDLKVFHRGLTLAHGDLRCASCHLEGRHDGLHLADGTVLPMTEALRLCAQCHGPQFRDYRNGSHGGMTGYWDRARGPRARNHCVDCHDPHAPQLPGALPMPGPRDRGAPVAAAPTHARGAAHE